MSYREAYESFRWDVPADFNIAHWACRRWAAERHRLALNWEDESGETRALSYWDLAQAANRLSNALAALGVARGDRVALILPQRPETVVAYLACFQMGAIAVPLSFLFGPDALEYRLANSGAKVAIVDPLTAANLEPIRARLPQLAHVIGVAGARGAGMLDWEATACEGLAPFRHRAHAAHGPRGDHLHQRHDRPAQGRAAAALGAASATFPVSSTPTTAFRARAISSGRPPTGPGPAASGMRSCRRSTTGARSWAIAGASIRNERSTCWRSTRCATRSCFPRRSR